MPAWDVVEFEPLLDSSDITVREWNQIGRAIAARYDDYDGFVVLHGTDTAVEVEAQGLTGITVPKGNAGLQTVLVLPEYVEAPVSKGQQLGTAAFYQGDIYLYEVPLTAASSVPRLTFSRALLRLLDNMLK